MVANIMKEAREKHEAWFSAFVEFIANHHGKVGEEFSIDHSDCEFGKWLTDVGLKQHGDLPEMHELAHAHHLLHSHVQSIVERQHIHMKSRLEMVKVEQAKDQVLDLLEKLEHKLA